MKTDVFTATVNRSLYQNKKRTLEKTKSKNSIYELNLFIYLFITAVSKNLTNTLLDMFTCKPTNKQTKERRTQIKAMVTTIGFCRPLSPLMEYIPYVLHRSSLVKNSENTCT